MNPHLGSSRQHRIHAWTGHCQPLSLDSTASSTSLKTTTSFWSSSVLLPLSPLLKLRRLLEAFTDELVEHFRRSPIEEVRRRLARDRPPYRLLPRFLHAYHLFLAVRCLLLLLLLLNKSPDDQSTTSFSALASLDITFEILYLKEPLLTRYPLIIFYIIFLLIWSSHATLLFFHHLDDHVDHHHHHHHQRRPLLLAPFGELLLANYDRFLAFHQRHQRPPLDPLQQEPAYLNAIRLTRQNLVAYRDRSRERLLTSYLSSKLYSTILSVGLTYELSYDRYLSYSQLLFLLATVYRLFTWPTAHLSYLFTVPVYLDAFAIGLCLGHALKLLKLTYCLGRIISLAFHHQLAVLARQLKRKSSPFHLHAVLHQRIFSGKVRTVRRLQVTLLVHLLRLNSVFSVLYSYWLAAVLPLAGGLLFIANQAKEASSEVPDFSHFVTRYLDPGQSMKALLNSTDSGANSTTDLISLNLVSDSKNSASSSSSSSLDSVKLSLSVVALLWLASKWLYTVQQVGRLNDRLAAFYPLLAAFQARQGTYYRSVLSLLKAMVYLELLGGGGGGGGGGRGSGRKLYALTVAGDQVASTGSALAVWAYLVGLLMMASKLCAGGGGNRSSED
ncbi:hypothetical protein TYRP_015136 [Tyrophagus putrescentiae]|nr:hypothetical protein TYRP_015136 [Tyrophagus putrescentiae]